MSEYDPEAWKLSEHREWMKSWKPAQLAVPLTNLVVEVNGVALPPEELDEILNKR